MAEREYSTTAAPQGYACRIGGVHVPWGATVRIDLDALPDWDAAHKWVRRGWLVPVAPLPEPDNTPAPDISDADYLSAMADIEEVEAMAADYDGTRGPQVTHSDVKEHLSAHTVAELRAMCTARGISYNGLRKSDLVEVLSDGE